MKHVHDSARERKQKNTDTEPSRGKMRDAHIRWVNNDHRLTDTAKIVAAALLTLYTNAKIYQAHGKLVVWPTARALALDCGISKSTADRCLDALVETGHLAPWRGLVPRREEQSKHRLSDPYAFTEPPVGYLYLWPDFDPEDERFHNGALSHPRRDKGKAELCPTQDGTKEGKPLSQIQGGFVPNSGDLCPTKMKEVPENPRFANTPIEYNTKNRNTKNGILPPTAAIGILGEGAQDDLGRIVVESGLHERLAEARLTGRDIDALRAATENLHGELTWGEIGATTDDGRPITAMPTFDEYIEHSTGEDLLYFFGDYVDDNGRRKDAAEIEEAKNRKWSALEKRIAEIAGEPPLSPPVAGAPAPEPEPAVAPVPTTSAAELARAEAKAQWERDYRAKHGLSADDPLF